MSLHKLKVRMTGLPSCSHNETTNKDGSWATAGSAQEEVVVVAYQKALIDSIVGTDQKLDIFNNKMIEFMAEQAPKNCESNCYPHCSPISIHSHLKDKIFADIQKFSSCLQLVENANLTGGILT